MRDRAQTAVIYFAFALTGVAVALLGAALPAMLQEWHLTDARGGWLLFSSFAGSTLGALVVTRAFRLLAAIGLVASCAAMLLLSSSFHAPFLPGFLLYGLGLGTTMTAISVLRSRTVAPGRSNIELNRLNLVWAVGACFAPALALHSLRRVSVKTLFLAEALAFAAAAIALFLSPRAQLLLSPSSADQGIRLEQFAPPRMYIFACAAVGLETAIGSWLTTYAERVAHGAGIAVSANSAFWIGLLLSRAASSFHAGDWLHSRRGIAAHLAAVTLAVLLLVSFPNGAVLAVAALLAGLGLGPLYPLVLSLALPRYRSGAVFALAGVGATVLPWATGLLSTLFQSLRAGLAAPAATVVVLLICAILLWRELPGQGEVST